jgi:hypothetical protein
MTKFKPGDTVIFDFANLNTSGLKESEKIEYYGDLGYGRKKPLLFTFICEHSPQDGHCVLVNMENQKVETMRETDQFRLATEDECITRIFITDEEIEKLEEEC